MINLYGKISRLEKNGKGCVFSVAQTSVLMKKSQVAPAIYEQIKDGLRVTVSAEADVVTAKEGKKKVEHCLWFVKSFEVDPIQEFKEKH